MGTAILIGLIAMSLAYLLAWRRQRISITEERRHVIQTAWVDVPPAPKCLHMPSQVRLVRTAAGELVAGLCVGCDAQLESDSDAVRRRVGLEERIQATEEAKRKWIELTADDDGDGTINGFSKGGWVR